ncbi:MAG: (2Fe-2S) ferredoxin domain-containing protein [Lentisphaeria bacterium]|nr:(2Fe-2S) ferredoxin domain-containing protein [Candidatus Neomarinimicrobiota bacterium]MCF7843015.1 (2Fe-2S) ferredoxin domain-containing protein [Lentisphaeria bacterium]
MSRFEKHVFICTNERPPGHRKGCCADCGGNQIKALLKARVKAAGLKNDIRINSAGCLDACEFGPVMVVYPEGVWYTCVKPEDVDDIFHSHLKAGEPVARLMIESKALKALTSRPTRDRFDGDRPCQPPENA